MADWIRRISVRVHRHIVVAARVRVLDGSARRSWRWSVRAVKTTYIWYAWFVASNVFDVIVVGHYELDEGAASPVVLAEDVRKPHSSVSLSLVVPVLLRAICVPPPNEGVTTLRDPLNGRDCSSNASSYAATQLKVCSRDLEHREQ